MTTAVAQRPVLQDQSVVDTQSTLMEAFAQFLQKVPESSLLEMAVFSAEDQFFWQLLGRLDSTDIRKLSPQVRNQIAFAKNKGRAFQLIKERCELLDSHTTCALLGISRQALSKKVQAGQVLAYTNGATKHYPAFQFSNNGVIAQVAKLVRETGVEIDEAHMNVLIGFLVVDMDFSDPLHPENLQPRYALLSDDAAFNIIVRDYKNRLEMGT